MISVNGERIEPHLIDEAFMRIKAATEAEVEGSCCERDGEFRERATEEVIEGVLLAQEAERRIAEPDADEVRTQLEQTLREWREHGASWDLLEAQRDQLRAEVIANLRMDRFVDAIWSELPELDEDARQAWYRDHHEAFLRKARAKVLHLVMFPGDADPAADYRTMIGLRQQILDGADFAELATRHTRKPDGTIDLGWIEHERVLNSFEAMLFSLREKELSPVFYYERALHLIWPESMEPEHIAPYEEVADQVRELAETAQRREALKALAAKLRNSATIIGLGDTAGDS